MTEASRELPVDQWLSLLKREGVTPPELPVTKSYCYALMSEWGLMSAALFHYPRGKLREHYTHECSWFHGAPESFETLWREYLLDYKPSDAVITASNVSANDFAVGDGGLPYWVSGQDTHYVYRVSATDSEKYYVGVSHVKISDASVEECLNDDYYGSGDHRAPKNKFLAWRRKHETTLTKEVLLRTPFRAEAFSLERELVGDRWRTDPLCLNSAPGGFGHHRDLHVRHGEGICEIHGPTYHQGARCRRCVAQKTISEGLCETHGEVTLWGGRCASCSQGPNVEALSCQVHGLTAHHDGHCYRCEQGGALRERDCPSHGATLHQGGSCVKCSQELRISLKACPTHGLTKHQGDSCYRCQSKPLVKTCEKHGKVTHLGDTCATCSVEEVYSKGECPTHGEVKLRGNKCVRCSAMLTAHKRFHEKKPNGDCPHCPA